MTQKTGDKHRITIFHHGLIVVLSFSENYLVTSMVDLT